MTFTAAGRVTIGTTSHGDGLMLTVSDTGAGMSPAMLAGVRRHFARADTSTVYEESCVGVGLSLVTEMARVCGAAIEMDSEIGAGTTVRVWFPWEPVYYPWFRKRRTVRAVLRPLDECCRDLTIAYTQFYGFEIAVVDDLAKLANFPDADVFLLDCRDDGESIAWLREACDEKRMFERQVIACLTAPAIEMRRCVERFAPPLKPDDMRRYFHQIALGKICAQSEYHARPPPVPTDLGVRVLAADDNATNQLVMMRMLARLGCVYKVVENGRLAVEAIAGGEQFDIVLMDQFMPVLDGPAAAREVRALPGEVARIPIIAMTASNLQEDEAACIAAGMDGFISKPVSLRRLGEVIVAHTLRTKSRG
jgi:CheY-like chemotaxis protein